jgi:hypothetical protein
VDPATPLTTDDRGCRRRGAAAPSGGLARSPFPSSTGRKESDMRRSSAEWGRRRTAVEETPSGGLARSPFPSSTGRKESDMRSVYDICHAIKLLFLWCFFQYSTDADAHTYAYTLISMNAHMHTLLL